MKASLPSVIAITACVCFGCLSGSPSAVANVPTGLQQAQQPDPRVAQAQQLMWENKLSEAEALLESVVKEKPQAGGAWYTLGLARHAQGKLDSALEAHLKAAEFQSLKPNALYNAACVYSLKKNLEKGLETLKLAVDAGFSDGAQMKSDTDLEFLRADSRFAALVPVYLGGSASFVEPTTVIHEIIGENANSEFGWVTRKAGDVDRDSVMDFVSTAPGFANHSGKVYVYSGKSGKLLFARQGRRGSRFGNSACGIDDQDGDKVPDLLIGGPMAGKGYAEVLSGKDGSVIRTLEGSEDGGQFGYKLCRTDDLDKDGIGDYAITSLNARGDSEQSGLCTVFSGKSGYKLFEIKGKSQAEKFGSAASYAKGVLVIGAQDAGQEKKGEVRAFGVGSGKPVQMFTFGGVKTSVDLGQMFLSFPGDFNTDGVPDLFCSDFSDQENGGRIFVISGKDGHVLWQSNAFFRGEGLGTSISDAGDADGDGCGDLIVGAWQNPQGARSGGKIYLISKNQKTPLATWTSKQAGETLGFDATGLGDVNKDGAVDFLFSSAWSPAKGPRTGRIFVIAGPKTKASKQLRAGQDRASR